MKTINKDIMLFTTEKAARKYFSSLAKSCQLLTSTKYGGYYVDTAKTAIKHWPELYTLISEK